MAGLPRRASHPARESDILWCATRMVQPQYSVYEHEVGHVAKLIGMPNHSRHVGQGQSGLIPPVPLAGFSFCTALKFLGADVDPPVPWQRVIASSGTISPRGEGGAQRQRDALEAEDVEVREGRTGDLLVDLDTYGWFPTREDIADE